MPARRFGAGLIAGLLLGVVAGAAAVWSSGHTNELTTSPPLAAAPPCDLRPATPAAAGEPQRSAEPPATREKTPEEQVEEAERARIAREQAQLECERAERERRRDAAEAKRKQEEEKRDRERHRQVMRELDVASRRNARSKVQITMYSTTWCGVCNKARTYMREKQIAFTELDVDRDEAAKAKALSLNPGGGVPTIVIGDQLLIGFSPAALEQRIGKAAERYQGI